MGWPGPNVARAPSGGDSECLHWMLLEPIHGGHCLPDQQTTWFEYSSSEAAHRPATGVAYISAFVCHQNFPATLLLNPLTLKSRCWNLLGTVCHAPSARWPEAPVFASPAEKRARFGQCQAPVWLSKSTSPQSVLSLLLLLWSVHKIHKLPGWNIWGLAGRQAALEAPGFISQTFAVVHRKLLDPQNASQLVAIHSGTIDTTNRTFHFRTRRKAMQALGPMRTYRGGWMIACPLGHQSKVYHDFPLCIYSFAAPDAWASFLLLPMPASEASKICMDADIGGI